MNTIVLRGTRLLGTFVQRAGPYLLLEILLPGGTLFALLLLAYRRYGPRHGAPMPRPILAAARVLAVAVRIVAGAASMVADTMRLGGIASAWRGRANERDGLEALALAP
jgi:hypothetical protein